MYVTADHLREINFLGSDEYHRCSNSLLMYGFHHYLKKIGADIDTTNSTDKAVYIDTENPTELMKLLYPNSPWVHYIRINEPEKKGPRKRTRTIEALDYYLENHVSDGKMILFDSGFHAYAGFKDEADAVRFKLTVP